MNKDEESVSHLNRVEHRDGLDGNHHFLTKQNYQYYKHYCSPYENGTRIRRVLIPPCFYVVWKRNWICKQRNTKSCRPPNSAAIGKPLMRRRNRVPENADCAIFAAVWRNMAQLPNILVYQLVIAYKHLSLTQLYLGFNVFFISTCKLWLSKNIL